MTIDKPRLYRSLAVVLASTVIFGLQVGLEVKWYFSVLAGFVVYVTTLLGLAMLGGGEKSVK